MKCRALPRRAVWPLLRLWLARPRLLDRRNLRAQMDGRATPEARGAGPRQQRSPERAPIDETEAIGPDLGAECARIDPAFQHPSRVDAGQTVHSRIEGV